MPAIECRDLVVGFGDVRAVDGVSFDVAEGKLFAMLGPNGAGKSTTLSVLCTLRRPTAGTIRVAGFDLSRDAARVRARIGVLFQDATLDGRLTGMENLRLHALVYGVPRRERRRRLREAVDLTGLGEAIHRQTRTYSGGMKRRLEVARALLHRPAILFLDEPTLGLDPQTRRQLWGHLAGLVRDGVTLFLTTHAMAEAEAADHVAILDHGKLVAQGSPAQLKEALPTDAVTRQPEAARGASLEDVFVHLTGHSIRDDEASARDVQRAVLSKRGRLQP